MRTYAVAYVNFFDNELSVELVCANTMLEALSKHSKLSSDENGNPNAADGSWLDNAPNDIKELKQMFWDADAMIDVVEVDLKSLAPNDSGDDSTD